VVSKQGESICSASHSRVAPENVGSQKEQKCNTFASHTCNEVLLCVLGIRKKEVDNTKKRLSGPGLVANHRGVHDAEIEKK
jgi:hypothetical protein